MIEAEGLSKFYGRVRAVDDVSFSVAEGEILGLLGTNGAGKTTIMRMLTGVMPPSAGRASVDGFDVARSPLEARRRIGYLPERTPLYDEMRVRAFLRFAAGVKGLSGAGRDAAVDRVLEEAGLRHEARRILGNLSRGYRQRVGLAQALVGDPKILILDEPTVGLDPTQVVEARELIRSLAGRRTVILSTHILPEVAATCQKVLIIHRGRRMAWGPLEHLHTAFKTVTRVEATLRLANPDKARPVLLALPQVRSIEAVRREGNEAFAFTLKTSPDAPPAIARAVVEQGWALIELRETGASLEEVFMQAISTEASTAA